MDGRSVRLPRFADEELPPAPDGRHTSSGCTTSSALIPHPPAPAWRFFSGRSVAALVYSALIDQWFNSHSRFSFFFGRFLCAKGVVFTFLHFLSLFILFVFSPHPQDRVHYVSQPQPTLATSHVTSDQRDHTAHSQSARAPQSTLHRPHKLSVSVSDIRVERG